jgi:Transposase IS200 like
VAVFYLVLMQPLVTLLPLPCFQHHKLTYSNPVTTKLKWECKYHVVIVSKYRKKVRYGRLCDEVGKIIRQLCRQMRV